MAMAVHRRDAPPVPVTVGGVSVLLQPDEGGGSEVSVAEGEIRGLSWVLRWSSRGGGPMDGLRFLAGDSFGVLPPLAGSLIAFAVAEVQEHSVVWGLVADDAVAVRVVDAGGDAAVETVIGPELGGSAAFVVVLRPGREPVVVEPLGRDGSTLCREPVVPEPTDVTDVAERVQVRAVTRDSGRAHGTVVLEGSVDDATWEYGIAVSPDGELQTDFQLWHRGGGGGGGGAGPAPQPGPGRRLRVSGSGTAGDSWHLDGWADPAVTEVVLQLRSGERLRLPTAGHHLALGYVVFAVALPGDAVALVAEGLHADGRRLAWEDLRGRLAWIEGLMAEHREKHARASAPVPGAVRTLWHAAMGSVFEEAEQQRQGGDGRTRVVRPVRRADVAERWPIRPLLVPPQRDPESEQWILHGEHHRWEIGQVVGVGPVWFGGPDLGEKPDPDDRVSILGRGAIILRQFVTWSDPQPFRDPPNTSVRGRPAVLTQLTAAANNIDLVEFQWQEHPTAGLTEPLSGVSCSAEANPRHHSVEHLRRLIEDLRSID
jgi:hypothetical protein